MGQPRIPGTWRVPVQDGPVRQPAPRRLVLAAAASAALTVLVALVLAAGAGNGFGKHVGNAAQLLGALVAAMACGRAARRGGAEARGWTLLCIGMAMWVAAAALWASYGLTYDHAYPFPSLADVGFVGYAVPVSAALLAFPRDGLERVSALRTTFDGLLIGIGALFVSAATVLGPLLAADGDPLPVRLTAISYPVVDVAICSLVLILALRRPAGARLRWVLLGGGLFALAVCDTLFVSATTTGAPTTGTPLQAGWLGSFLLVALATLVPPRVTAVNRAHFTVLQELLPYLPVVAAAVVLALRSEPVRLSDPLLGGLALLLLLVLVVQQVLVAVEKVTLTRSLEDAFIRRGAQLRTAEDRFGSLVDSSEDAIVATTVDGVITSWNPAAERLFGHPADDVVGRSVDLVVPPDLIAEHRELLARVAEGERRRIETTRLRADGSLVPVALTVSPILDGSEVRGISLIGNDITERKRTEQALAEARDQAMAGSRAKSDFLATMSHEIRTPMNGVVGLTGLLLDTELTDVQRRYASGVQGAGEALLAIIDDILDFSKLEAGKVELEDSEFDPRRLVEDVGLLLGSTASAKGLEMVAFCTPDMPARLRGDAGRLRQILLNLASNALKFTAAGDVVVRAETSPGAAATDRTQVRFAVSDTGVGIDAEAAARLFQPFTQADASTTRQFGGTGLGLAICAQLVRAMGGKIELDSAPGAGSTFSFTIDLAVCGTPPVPEQHGHLAGARVLVADDNDTNRTVLAGQLRAWGLRPDLAHDGPAALEMARLAAGRGEPYDIAILDLCMPGMDGLDLARALSADPVTAGARKMILSSAGGLDRDAAEQAQVLQWASKPVRSSELHDALVRLVAGAPEPEPARGSPAAEQLALRGKVLVVEDNEVNRLVAQGMLHRLGISPELVSDGVEALAALDREDFDLVLMDCHMPRMDGFTATREIRRREATHNGNAAPRRLPIVAMSAGVLTQDRERCLDAGMDDFISKPVDPAVLAEKVQRYLPAGGDGDPPPLPDAGGDAPAAPGVDLTRLDVLRRLDPDGAKGLLGAVVAAFVEHAPRRMAALRAAVREGGQRPLEQAAHELVGASANVGAVAVADLCRQLEEHARAGRAPEPGILEQLDAEMDRTTRALAAAVAVPG